MISLLYKKHASLLLFVLFAVAILGTAWFGIRPLERSLEGKMRGIQEFYAGRENRERQVTRLPELENQYRTIVANEKMLNVLITEDKVVDFVKTLETLASDMNVQMSILSKDEGKIIERKKLPIAVPNRDSGSADADVPIAKQKSPDIVDDVVFGRYLRVSVEVRGQYGDIVTFLQKMETLPLGLDVVGVAMKKASEEPSRRSSGPGENPFAVLGGNQSVPVVQPSAVPEGLEATFDVLVYVDKP